MSRLQMTTGRRNDWPGGSRTTAVWAATAVVAALICAVASVADEPDVSGVYCAARPRGCCAGRQDDCSAPILGTLCYCDDFCNHTRNEDCCPDFWSYCKGVVSQPFKIKSE